MPSKHGNARSRRTVLPGYPRKFKFVDPDALRRYFEGDRIVCLMCGKTYRKLGVHLLKIHTMTPDEYRARFGIPWTYGLCCGETTELHSEEAKLKYVTGEWRASKEQAQMARLALRSQKTRQPIRDVLAARNLEKMNEGKTGEEQARRNAAAQRGTPEHREKMLNRPQTKNPSDNFLSWWKGKKQSEAHVQKKVEALQKTLQKQREQSGNPDDPT